MTKYDLAAVGDCVLRLSTGPRNVLAETPDLEVDISGTELNLSSNVAALGWKVAFASALPQNAIGKRLTLPLRAAGADISHMRWRKSGRVSTYYVQFGSGPRGSSIIYDRANSCFDLLTKEDIDWDALANARIVHFSGVTAALSARSLGLCQAMLEAGRKHGAKVSIDVNFRPGLWTRQQARTTLGSLITQADICFCPLRDAADVFGISGNASDAAAKLSELAGGALAVVSNGSEQVHARDSKQSASVTPPAVQIADRIGAGDGLAAGVLHGILKDADLESCLRYGTTMAALALAKRGEQVGIDDAELAEICEQSEQAEQLKR